jgi:hypothetical protein
MDTFGQNKIKGVLLEPLREEPSQEMYCSLFERLEDEAARARQESRRRAHARAWELAKQQGVAPIRDINELKGDFWPEDESIDDFLAWLRATRRED